MHNIIDLETYPIDEDGSEAWQTLVARCKADLSSDGMFNLPGFVREEALGPLVAALKPKLQDEAFTHSRRHNIYFKPDLPGLAPDHPALGELETVNHTLCADQLSELVVTGLYKFPPFARFLAHVMDKDALYTMDDPLAAVNVMSYDAGEALNWHFDRSEFTTTLLLQAPENGGEFVYRTDLRSDDDPNYAGVAKLLTGQDDAVKTIRLAAGTLNVFRGKNTAHRVTPVVGATARIISVFSFFDRPGVVFSEAEQKGFYGRSVAL